MAVATGYVGSAAITWSASATATVSGQSIGTAAWDRVVIVAVTVEANVTINSATLDGAAMTTAASLNITNTAATPDLAARFFYLPVAAGTTADVAVTVSASSSVSGRISVWAMTGAALPHFDQNTNTGSGATLTLTGVTINTNGAGFWVFNNATDTTAVAWTNATERDDTDAGTYRHSVADSVTAGTATITADGATAQQAIVGMSFNERPPLGFDLIAPDTSIDARTGAAVKAFALVVASGLTFVPAPPAEAAVTYVYPTAVTTTGGIFKKTLYYQAKIAPPPQEAVVGEAATFSLISGRAVRKSLYYQSIVRPVAAPVVDNNQTIDKWLQPLSIAVDRPQVQSRPYSPFVPDEAVLRNTVTPDKWLQRWQGPVPHGWPIKQLAPFVPKEAVLDNTVTPDKWLIKWQGPPRYLLELPGGAPFIPKEAVLENTVTPDNWLMRWQGPPRYLQPLPGGAPFVPKEAVLENTVTPDAWMQPFYKAVTPLPRTVSNVTYAPIAPEVDNTITIDKWRLEWNLAAKTPKPVPTQPVFGYPYEAEDNLTTTLEWLQKWQGPPRYTPTLPGGQPFVPKEAVLENTVTPDKWLQAWKAPPAYRPIKVQTPPFVPKAAVLENTVTPDAWLQRWQGPPRYRPIKVQTPPFVPREAVLENTVTPDKWLMKWPGPPSYSPAPAGGAPFVPREAVLENTVTLEKWLVRFSKAVPVPKPVPTQPVFGYPYESEVTVVPYEQWWQQPLSRAAPIRWPRYAAVTVPYYPYAGVEVEVTADKWLQPFGRAIARAPIRDTNTPVPFSYAATPIFYFTTQHTNVSFPRVLYAKNFFEGKEPPPFFEPPNLGLAETVNRSIFTRTLYYQSHIGLEWAPAPTPPVETTMVAAQVTLTVTFTRPLYYQAYTLPFLPLPPVPVVAPPKVWIEDGATDATWTPDAETAQDWVRDVSVSGSWVVETPAPVTWVDDEAESGDDWTDDEPDP